MSTDFVYLTSNYKTILDASSPTFEDEGGESSSSQDLLGNLEPSLGMQLNFVAFCPDQLEASLLPFALDTLKDGAVSGSGCLRLVPCSPLEVRLPLFIWPHALILNHIA